MCLEGDCREVEVTPNLELLVTFIMSLELICHEFFYISSLNRKLGAGCDLIVKRAPYLLMLGMRKL
jgi:hypothetical protein